MIEWQAGCTAADRQARRASQAKPGQTHFKGQVCHHGSVPFAWQTTVWNSPCKVASLLRIYLTKVHCLKFRHCEQLS